MDTDGELVRLAREAETLRAEVAGLEAKRSRLLKVESKLRELLGARPLRPMRDENYGVAQRRIVEVLSEAGQPMAARAVADAIGHPRHLIDSLLRHAVLKGRISHVGRGLYACPVPGAAAETP